MDEIIFIPITAIIVIIVIVGGISYSLYLDKETLKFAMKHRCELIKTDCSKNLVWGNCKGPIIQENVNVDK